MATVVSGAEQHFGRLGGNIVTLRAAAILTTGYVAATNDLQINGASKALLLFNFTKGDSTGFTFKIEGSDDAVTFYEFSYEDTSTNPHTLRILENTVDATAIRSYLVTNPFKLLRVSAKALTVATGTSLTVTAKAVIEPQFSVGQ